MKKAVIIRPRDIFEPIWQFLAVPLSQNYQNNKGKEEMQKMKAISYFNNGLFYSIVIKKKAWILHTSKY